MKFGTRVQIALALLIGRFGAYGHCGNRFWCKALSPSGHEITVIYRRTYEPDGYSREELVKMLCTVREHQKIQGWTAQEIEVADRYACNEEGAVSPEGSR